MAFCLGQSASPIRYHFGNGVGSTMLGSGHHINNYGPWIVDSDCGRLLRRLVDECNTSGEKGKQGGYVIDPCGEWRSDPGYWQTDCKACRDAWYITYSQVCQSYGDGAPAFECFLQAAQNAWNACIANSNCGLGSGLGPNGDNCDVGDNAY
ncbi:hypothetical protein FB451DRAFT_1183907 [Mycena latifolia]|nr:hypothetical protein FB451DRAFT_1183907 [Mycena latifolia]